MFSEHNRFTATASRSGVEVSKGLAANDLIDLVDFDCRCNQLPLLSSDMEPGQSYCRCVPRVEGSTAADDCTNCDPSSEHACDILHANTQTSSAKTQLFVLVSRCITRTTQHRKRRWAKKMSYRRYVVSSPCARSEPKQKFLPSMGQ